MADDKDPLGILVTPKAPVDNSDPLGILKKKELSAPALPGGLNSLPTGSDLSQSSQTDPYIGITDSALRHKLKENDAHYAATKVAEKMKQSVGTLPPKSPLDPPKPERGIVEEAAQAIYAPAFNEGFNDLVTKPYVAASDFFNRTIDKLYHGITGEYAPDWLTGDHKGNKNNILHNLVNGYEEAYKNRDKPTNLASEVAEGTVGSLPLMASLFTGQGEASLATKLPNLFSKTAKIMGTTGALNAYEDATRAGKDDTESLKEGAKGAVKGVEQGLELDAQMLVGGALGKGVVGKLAEKGLLKGGKAGEALIHAIATGTVFSGSSAGNDLLSGKDIDGREAAKQFGMGLAFEAIPVAKGLHDEISNNIEGKKIDESAAKAGVATAAASNMNAESMMRTLMNTPSERLQAINDNVSVHHEDLYAQSLENGMKAYEAADPNEKRTFYGNQLLLKAQGDVKNISSKLADPEIKQAMTDDIVHSDELTDDHKAELLQKLDILTPEPNEQVEPPVQDVPVTEQKPAEQNEEKPVNKVDDQPENKVDEPKAEVPEPPKASEESGVAPQLEKAVNDKVEELKSKTDATNAKLKDQKKDLIDQVNDVQEALWGTETTNNRKNIEELNKSGQVDIGAEQIYPEGWQQRVKDAGYEVNEKGQIVFQVKDDGVFKIHADNIIDTGDQIKKEFTTDIDKKIPEKETKAQKIGKPGTGTDIDTDLIKENIAEAKRLGNTKMQSVFERELARHEKEGILEKTSDQKEAKTAPKEEEKPVEVPEKAEKEGNHEMGKVKVIDKALLQPSKLKGSKYNLVLAELPDGKFGIVDTGTGYTVSQPYDDAVSARLAYSKNREKLTPQVIDDAIAKIEGRKPQMAASVSLPFMNEFIEHDVKPAVQKIATNFKEALGSIVRTISPKTGVSLKAKDIVTTNLNARNESAAEVDKAIGAIEKMFDKMPDTQRVDFIDRLKRGKKQPTPELQAIADMYGKMDKDLYDEVSQFKESLPFKENHFRVLWKELPGSEKSRSWFGMSKRPLEGSKGFLKKATLADISEGIDRGGVPLSTNPMTMFKAAYADAMKFITAHRMFDALKADDYVKFVKNGGEVPEGYIKIDDKIASVYFPVKEGLVKTGEYYIEKNVGRLVNNHLSRDLIRESSIGMGLMNLKNLYTAAELGLSAYHASAIALEGVSSDIARGYRKLVSLGLKGDFKSAGEGIMDIIKAPLSPYITFSLGRKTINLATEGEFEKSDFGKKFLAANPLAKEYVHDMFMGGGLMKQSADLKANTYKSMREAAGKDNYIGAALRAIPALNEIVMSPLFDHYIPAMKVGMFMKEFPLVLKEQEASIVSGKTTRAEVARKTVDFIDDRLGEMNFDNLFWNRTFKTSMQLMLRSVTWKLGNLRAMGGAPIEQAMEFYNAAKEKRAPNLSPKLAWVLGLATMQTALSTVTQYMFTGTYPSSIKDLIAPRLSKEDDKQRMILPTYVKDVMHLKYKGPVDYATSSLSGDISKLGDIWSNSDFQKYQIYNPNDDVLDKAKDIGEYVLPKPISISSLQKSIKEGDSYPQMAMSFFGLNKAPKYLTNPPIENKIFDLYNMHEGVKSKGQKDVRDVKQQILSLYRQNKYDEAEKVATEAMEKGEITQRQFGYLNKRVGAQSESPAHYFYNTLPVDDKVALWKEMTPAERQEYDPKGKIQLLIEEQERYEKQHQKKDKPYSSFGK